MPPKSKKQERFMQAVANNPDFAKKVKVPTKVGKEFTKETKVKKYKEGGMSEEDKKMFGEKETDLPPPKGFKKSDDKETKKETKKKVGGKIGTGMTKNNYKKGGSCSSKSYKKGGMVKRDGCAVRGKTKGRMV